MKTQFLEKILSCPLCESSMTVTNEKTSCTNCDYQSKVVDGIPWHFKNPVEIYADWRNRFGHYSKNLGHNISQIESDLAESDLLESSRQRLRDQKKAMQKQNKHFIDLMSSMKVDFDISSDLFKGLKTALPMSQRLMSYEANVFRDWVWGEEENKGSFELVREVIEKSGAEFDELVVLGSGAGRLPYDIQKNKNLKDVLLFDINPFLQTVAKKVIAGEKVNLVEFPVSPINKKSRHIESTLQVPQSEFSEPNKESDAFSFLISDALTLHLKTESVQAVMTPWFIDIIPQDIDIFFRQLNRVLENGGTWINFGSFAFHHQDYSICYSKEELFEIVELCGFEILSQEERVLPYLKSPYSCQSRDEQMLCFVAKKVKEVDQYEAIDYLPEWITDSAKPVPKLDVFSTYIFVNQIQFEVLRAVDGQVSIEQIAHAVREKYKMQDDQALAAVQGFFTKVFEENLFQGMG